MVLAEDPDFEAMKLEEQLADQRGGLERVTGALALKQCRRDTLQAEKASL